MNRNRLLAERAVLVERMNFIDAVLNPPKPKSGRVLDFTDLTACKNKVRQSSYWHLGIIVSDDGVPTPCLTRIQNVMSKGCKYDRRLVDPACSGCKELSNGEVK